MPIESGFVHFAAKLNVPRPGVSDPEPLPHKRVLGLLDHKDEPNEKTEEKRQVATMSKAENLEATNGEGNAGVWDLTDIDTAPAEKEPKRARLDTASPIESGFVHLAAKLDGRDSKYSHFGSPCDVAAKLNLNSPSRNHVHALLWDEAPRRRQARVRDVARFATVFYRTCGSGSPQKATFS